MEWVIKIFAALGALGSFASATIAVGRWLQLRRWNRRLSWDDSLRIAEKLLAQIEQSGWVPEIVVGLGRSGGIWGGWLAGNLGSLPFAVVDDKYPEIEFPAGDGVLDAVLKTYPGLRRILVVEGASSTGETFNTFQSCFAGKFKGIELRFAVLYQSPLSRAEIHYVGKVGPEHWPKRFPWHDRDRYRPYLRDMFTVKKTQS